MPILVPPSGPSPARLMIVGEAPGVEEELKLQPFVGASGQELDRMLRDAGIMRSEAFVTNVSKVRPPSNDINNFIAKSKAQVTSRHVRLRDKWVTPEIWEGVKLLEAEIKAVKPNVILALGNTSMWALTGKWGIKKWRGSMLVSDLDLNTKVVPSYHPAAVLRQWDIRSHGVLDMRRAGRFLNGEAYPKPKWNFRVRPTIETCRVVFNEILELLEKEPTRLSFDIETRGGHMSCVGLSWTLLDAICIPLSLANRIEGYWSLDEETWIVWQLRLILTHANAQVVGQNIIYDCQYLWKHWHFVPRVTQDCMISQHSLFSDLPKSLAFQASMYCDYFTYWKDEAKEWEPGIGEESLWYYNCEDCVYTDEVGRAELETVDKLKLESVHEFQQKLFWPVLRAMQLGVKIDLAVRDRLISEVKDAIRKREDFLVEVLGHPLNPQSPKQMKALFYEDLKQPVILTRATKDKPATPTLNDEAITKIALREPLLKPICTAIADIRTLRIFLSSFLLAELDEDQRLRCSYNIGGSASGKSAPKTYRLSSSENAFGGGCNLQTIPSKTSKSLNKAKTRGTIDLLGDPYQFPNLREMFVPDEGKTMFDGDLDRADLQVVVYEADDAMLKAALKLGADLHLMNAFVLAGKEPPPLEELVKKHSRYEEHLGPKTAAREFAKVFVHGCVTKDHDVLTKDGWISVANIQDGIEIAVWDSDTRAIHFETPEFWNRDVAITGETLMLFQGQAYSQLVTSNHKMPFTLDKNIQSIDAVNLPRLRNARLPKSGWYSGTVRASDVRLIVAFIADGTMDSYGNVIFHFHKERKKERLRMLLQNYEYSESPDSTRFYVPHRAANFTRYGKQYDKWILDLDGESLDQLIEEQVYWDGTAGKTGSVTVSSIHRDSLEWLRTAAHLRYKASQFQGEYESGFGSTVYRISFNNRPLAQMSSLETILPIKLDRDVKVYCPKTTTGFFLVRRQGKISVTGNTNYLGQPRTMAAHTGRTVHEVERAQNLWFGAHPGIKKWHTRIIEQVTKYRFVENRFGYKWRIFDRIDSIMSEAVSWIPQSTVSVVINKIWMNIHETLPEVETLMQVHDSLIGQFPDNKPEYKVKIEEAAKIVVPYPDPLVIPFSVKVSNISWGACK